MPQSPDDSLVEMLALIRGNLGEALTIAKAAELCARDGYPDRAMTVVLDVESFLHDSNHMLQGMAVIMRKRNNVVEG